jgi:hypothetical protein
VAGADRMTIEEVVRKVLLDEHADVIREAVKAVAAELMELEVSGLIGGRARGAPTAGPRRRIAMGIGPGAGTPAPVRSSCRSSRSAKAATSRASWSRAGAPSRRPRRRPADRHSTPARTQQPRHHLRLPSRHRQRRDHRQRPRPPRTDDPRQRITPTVKTKAQEHRSSRDAALSRQQKMQTAAQRSGRRAGSAGCRVFGLGAPVRA